jgi:Tetratricopeptide repeat.
MAILSVAELLSQGRRARQDKRLADAKEFFERATDYCRKSGNKAILAEALCGLGQIQRDQGNISAALDHYSEAAGLRRTGGDTLALAHAIRHVADILREQGNSAKAAPCYEEALEIYRSHTDAPPLDTANAIRGYALVQANLDNADESVLLWRQAAVLYEQADIKEGVAESKLQIAFLLGR